MDFDQETHDTISRGDCPDECPLHELAGGACGPWLEDYINKNSLTEVRGMCITVYRHITSKSSFKDRFNKNLQGVANADQRRN
jgi:hypothetical protein